MATTLGVTTVLAGTDNNDSGVASISGGYTTDSTNVSIVNGQLYFKSIGGSGTRSQKMRLLIYNGTATAPSTSFVAVSDEVTVSNATTAGTWITFTFSTAGQLSPNTIYWLGAWWGTETITGDDWVVAADTNGTALQYFDTSLTYASTGAPPTVTWSAGPSDQQYSLYLNMQPGVVAPNADVPRTDAHKEFGPF